MRSVMIGAVLLVVGSVARVEAVTTVYEKDFSITAPGSEWSSAAWGTTPSGRKFLGQFGGSTTYSPVSLTLPGLPAHSAIDVSFDLFVLKSWDGNDNTPGGLNKDYWRFGVTGDAPLVNTTFCNLWWRTDVPQAYPGTYPDSNPAQTGATAVQTLGYTNPSGGQLCDAIYSIQKSFTHSGDTLQLDFGSYGTGIQDVFDESWGVANIRVNVVPEPSAFVLLGVGAAGLLSYVWRRRKLAA